MDLTLPNYSNCSPISATLVLNYRIPYFKYEQQVCCRCKCKLRIKYQVYTCMIKPRFKVSNGSKTESESAVQELVPTQAGWSSSRNMTQ
jgi:hypothetical protein